MFRNLVVAAIAFVAVEETQAIKMKAEQKAKLDAAVDQYLNAESGSDAEWGFLKNIVNIDKFFDSGVKA